MKKTKDLRIVFMGTPEFAVASLEKLCDAGYNIVGVITSTDKLGGRGRKTVIESAVKKYALSKGLNILQPKNLKSETFRNELFKLKADLQIVVAFRMLPEVIWNMPPLGTYNLHGSLLPKYRGAAPINWAVINGEKTTGVTTFKLKHAIDTGSVLLQREIPINDEDNASTVHDSLMNVGADLVLETVQTIESNEIKLLEQDERQACHAPKLSRENTQINFDNPGTQIKNLIRGLSDYPCAWFSLDQLNCKVYKAIFIEEESRIENGSIVSDNKTFFKIKCQDGFIDLKEIQLTGKKRMAIKELLNGFDTDSLENTRVELQVFS